MFLFSLSCLCDILDRVGQCYSYLIGAFAIKCTVHCLQHAVVTQVPRIPFCIASGCSNRPFSIIVSALLRFSEQVRNNNLFFLESVKISQFDWIGNHIKHSSSQYDGILKLSRATDLHNLGS